MQAYSFDSRCADRVRGCLFGGAVGDALGYPIEFLSEREIVQSYGNTGIQEYSIDPESGTALFSDDTQMTLFTADGILAAESAYSVSEQPEQLRRFIALAYQDWLRTQELTFEEASGEDRFVSWLADIPQLYSRRAPGNTCLSALERQRRGLGQAEDYILVPQNNSKGCGGIMRIAPAGLIDPAVPIETLDLEAAQIAAITHGNSLGYMPAAVMAHIIRRIVFPEKEMSLTAIAKEALETTEKLFADDPRINKLAHKVAQAISFAENGEPDIINIHHLGEGWVGDEALAVSLYCALRHEDSFSDGVRAASNHNGDSDSTGSLTGSILGAYLGFGAIDEMWKKDLELADVVLEIADDFCTALSAGDARQIDDPAWEQKYIRMRRMV